MVHQPDIIIFPFLYTQDFLRRCPCANLINYAKPLPSSSSNSCVQLQKEHLDRLECIELLSCKHTWENEHSFFSAPMFAWTCVCVCINLCSIYIDISSNITLDYSVIQFPPHNTYSHYCSAKWPTFAFSALWRTHNTIQQKIYFIWYNLL